MCVQSFCLTASLFSQVKEPFREDKQPPYHKDIWEKGVQQSDSYSHTSSALLYWEKTELYLKSL